MITTTIPEEDILTVVVKKVSSNGTISIGKEFVGRRIKAYVIEDTNVGT